MATDQTTESRRTSASSTRPPRRVPLVPKEHGASFMSIHALLLGIVAGFVSGGGGVAGLALSLAFGAVFLPLAAAVSVLSHPGMAERARRRAVELGAVAAGLGVLAVWHGPARQLVLLAVAAIPVGALYAASRIRTGARSIPTQLAAIAGISLLAPLAWLLIGGVTSGWSLAGVAAFLSFGGTVPYVRERVRRRRTRGAGAADRLRGGAFALAWQAVVLAVAGSAAAAGVVHVLVPLAFLPGGIKTAIGIARPEAAPPMRRLGVIETAVSTAFAVLAGVGLAL